MTKCHIVGNHVTARINLDILTCDPLICTLNHHRFIISSQMEKFIGIQRINRPLVKSVYQKINFLISHPKHMLWVLKRTVSLRRFF